jgi:hypothetical protein
MMAMMLLAAWMGLNAQPSGLQLPTALPSLGLIERRRTLKAASRNVSQVRALLAELCMMAACRAPGAATPPAHRWLVRCCLAAAPPPLLVHGGPFAGAPEDARHYPAARRAESDSCCEVESVR